MYELFKINITIKSNGMDNKGRRKMQYIYFVGINYFLFNKERYIDNKNIIGICTYIIKK